MSVDLKKIAAAFPEFQLSSKSRHDGALLLQLQAADGRRGRTIPLAAAQRAAGDRVADPQHPPGTGRAGHGNGDGGTLSFSPREPMMR